MKHVTWRQATIADFAALCAPEEFPRTRTLLGGIADAFVGPSGEVVSLGGLMPINPRCAEAWNIPGPAFRDYLDAPRAIRRRLVELAREHGFARIQSTVLETDLASLRFDHWLGFVDEAALEDFGPAGEAAVVMRWRDK